MEDLIGSPVLVARAFLAVPGVTVQAGSVEVSEDSVIFVFNVTGLADKYREEAAGGLGAPTVTISLHNPDRGASAIIRIGSYTHPVPGGLLKPDTVVTINSTVLGELRREGAVLLVSYNSAPEPPRSARNNLTSVQGLGGGLELMADKRLETVEPPGMVGRQLQWRRPRRGVVKAREVGPGGILLCAENGLPFTS